MPEVLDILRSMVDRVTYLKVPELMFFREEVVTLKNRLKDCFNVTGEVYVTPHSSAASVVSGPRAPSLAFHPEH